MSYLFLSTALSFPPALIYSLSLSSPLTFISPSLSIASTMISPHHLLCNFSSFSFTLSVFSIYLSSFYCLSSFLKPIHCFNISLFLSFLLSLLGFHFTFLVNVDHSISFFPPFTFLRSRPCRPCRSLSPLNSLISLTSYLPLSYCLLSLSVWISF